MRELQAFFDDYRRAFARYDRDALTEVFAFPLQIVSVTDDATTIAVASREDWPGVLEGLLGSYRTLGVAEGVPLEMDVAELTPRASSVRVHWELRREDGSEIYDFTAIYTLALVNGSLHIVAIAHDELPKLQAALAAGSS